MNETGFERLGSSWSQKCRKQEGWQFISGRKGLQCLTRNVVNAKTASFSKNAAKNKNIIMECIVTAGTCTILDATEARVSGASRAFFELPSTKTFPAHRSFSGCEDLDHDLGLAFGQRLQSTHSKSRVRPPPRGRTRGDIGIGIKSGAKHGSSFGSGYGYGYGYASGGGGGKTLEARNGSHCSRCFHPLHTERVCPLARCARCWAYGHESEACVTASALEREASEQPFT